MAGVLSCNNKESDAIVGMEYMFGLSQQPATIKRFNCELCEEACDDDIQHLNSNCHRKKFLEKHFHDFYTKFTLKREFSECLSKQAGILSRICQIIESECVRMQLPRYYVYNYEAFVINENTIRDDIRSMFHFHQDCMPNNVELLMNAVAADGFGIFLEPFNDNQSPNGPAEPMEGIEDVPFVPFFAPLDEWARNIIN